jgi:amidase
MYAEAERQLQALQPTAPFAGVPFLIKDLGIHVAGYPLKTGSKGYADFVSKGDSYFTNRLREAGFIFLGKTNTPEFGLTPYTEPAAYGPTRNPWNTAHSPGGSSGGSAAAVAAGIAPLATASDGGGSIRIPAAFCGLFGLKPSRGRISMGPYFGEMWAGAVVEGCVARSVRDSAAFLDAVHGSVSGDPYLIQPPAKSFLTSLDEHSGKLHIAYSTQHTLGHEVNPDCVAAIQHTVAMLKDLGHTLTEVPLPYPKEALTQVFVAMIIGETAGDIAELEQHLGRKVTTQDVELNTWLLGALGKYYSAREYVVQKRAWNHLSRQMADFHRQYDLLLTPTMASPPFPIGALQNTTTENTLLKTLKNLGMVGLAKKQGAVDKLAEKVFGQMPYTPIANMTGQPAASVPLHWNEAQLPVGTMLTAAIGQETLLFQVAAQLEKQQPWLHRMPKI